MSFLDALGEHTVTVIEQVRGQHASRIDGPATAYPGCAFEPEDTSATERTTDNRDRDELRYRIFAPAGFRASASAMCTVQPGPENADGTPMRLSLAGAARPRYDEGVEDHVEVLVRVSTGTDRR